MNIPLKTKIIQSGKKQVEIAKELGIPDSHLSKIVGGWNDPRPTLKKSLAKILKCTVSEIFCG